MKLFKTEKGISRYTINEILGLNLITGAEYRVLKESQKKREFFLEWWLLDSILIEYNFYIDRD